ncbi:MAG: membrane protein insertion efficiency factor YidD [Saprospiraceae bacterium]|nr:membrane protein insertion efficiency factor YidD [Saprospiraceae bacterium]
MVNSRSELTHKLFLFVLFLAFSCFLSAQSNQELNDFKNFFEIKPHKHNWADQLKNNENEINMIFSVLFVFYKEVLSNQDIEACVMTPSCSVYAIESIKKKGVVFGLLNGFDRLTRCNPGKSKNLPIDKSTGKYYDPVNY